MSLKKSTALLLVMALTIPLAAACTKTNKNDDKTERVLRIASVNNYGTDDQNFRQQYTQVFEYANPNVKIEIVPLQDPYQYMYQKFDPASGQPPQRPKDPFDTLKEAMTQPNPPDVVMVGYEQFPELVRENLVAPLEPLIAKDKFDTTGIVPLVLDGLKKAGDGKLYGLSPTFSSSALIYNKQMFDAAGVPYPKDNMTWDETFDLARRLTRGEGDNRKYGFSFNSQAQDMFYAMQAYTMPLDLRMMDDKGEKMTVDTDQWEKVWTTMKQLNAEKIIPSPPDYSKPMMRSPQEQGPFAYDDFMSGRVAMTVMYYGQLAQLINANKNAENINGYTKIDWDVVTLPSHSQNPGVVAFAAPDAVFAINAKAANSDDAWKFIKFINGDDWAKLRGSSSYQMPARKAYIKPRDGIQFHVEAFYNIKPTGLMNELAKLSREKPNIYMVNDQGRQEFQAALSGQKSVRDALKAWQTSGDSMLQQIKENPNGPINRMPIGAVQAMPAGKG